MRSIYFTEVDTPLGSMHLGTTDIGICLFEFPISERIEQHKRQLSTVFEETATDPINIVATLTEQLHNYFSGKPTTFNLPIELVGTDFQIQAWKKLQEIPYGKTITYLEQAQALNNPGAIRAVAHANGQNRIAILVPCHRVIAGNGSLQGFSGGLWRKEHLLSLEKGQARIHF